MSYKQITVRKIRGNHEVFDSPSYISYTSSGVCFQIIDKDGTTHYFPSSNLEKIEVKEFDENE